MSTLPVGYVIAYKRPSKNCGPFSGQEQFYSIIGQVLRQHLPKSLVEVISYFMSPGIIFPVSILQLLILAPLHNIRVQSHFMRPIKRNLDFLRFNSWVWVPVGLGPFLSLSLEISERYSQLCILNYSLIFIYLKKFSKNERNFFVLAIKKLFDLLT